MHGKACGTWDLAERISLVRLGWAQWAALLHDDNLSGTSNGEVIL